MFYVIFIAVLIHLATSFKDPEVTLSAEGIIRRWNYPVERYDVETKDGYVIELLRIPRGRKDRSSEPKIQCRPVILMIHSNPWDASQYVINPPDKAPAFVFADAGYDVFLGSVRGTKFSRKHKDYSTSDHRFWDFSFDEIATYDIPAFIDKALAVSGASKLYYVGHSQGSVVGYSLLADQPSYNDKVKAAFMWGTANNGKNIQGIASYLVPFASFLKPVTQVINTFIGALETAPSAPAIYATIAEIACAPGIRAKFCLKLLGYAVGPSEAPWNETRIPVYAAHVLAGTSSKIALHALQLPTSGKHHSKFDYGLDNFRRYGSFSPPLYNYEKIRVPIHLYWSENEVISNAKEIDALTSRMAKGIIQSSTNIPEYGHYDYTVVMDAPEKVYLPMIEQMKAHEAKEPSCGGAPSSQPLLRTTPYAVPPLRITQSSLRPTQPTSTSTALPSATTTPSSTTTTPSSTTTTPSSATTTPSSTTTTPSSTTTAPPSATPLWTTGAAFPTMPADLFEYVDTSASTSRLPRANSEGVATSNGVIYRVITEAPYAFAPHVPSTPSPPVIGGTSTYSSPLRLDPVDAKIQQPASNSVTASKPPVSVLYERPTSQPVSGRTLRSPSPIRTDVPEGKGVPAPEEKVAPNAGTSQPSSGGTWTHSPPMRVDPQGSKIISAPEQPVSVVPEIPTGAVPTIKTDPDIVNKVKFDGSQEYMTPVDILKEI